MDPTTEARLKRAQVSLEGLSVGDAFGDLHLNRNRVRELPSAPWRFTDDTQMALSITTVLRMYGEVEQKSLAHSFGAHFEIERGYGPGMHRLLPRLRAGEPWESLTQALFNGHGSFGNGGAMRVAPLGAYFADDLDAVVEQAKKSAEVTHAHPEGVAGAVAVAFAAAVACRLREEAGTTAPNPRDFLDLVLARMPASAVHEGIRQARDLPPDTDVAAAAAALGNGSRVSAQDTVPFTLWCASHYLDNYEEALWATTSALGDRDTNCAIVGGIVACFTGEDGIPEEWWLARESLPEWYD